MRTKLREGEQKILETRIHWITVVRPFFVLFFATVLLKSLDANKVVRFDVEQGKYEYHGGAGEPIINITDETDTIVDGGTFDFATRRINSNTDKEFKIQTLSDFNITFNGSPIIVITGTNANQFSVVSQPTTPITSGGHVRFTLRFTPTSAGIKVAAISIESNDDDENPYVINLTGTGIGPTYYVDSSITDTHAASAVPDFTTYNPTTFETDTGSDSVYKTIADVNACTFSPGDFILFRKGQTWVEQLTVPSSGSAGLPITFGAFGTGDDPIIRADDLITPGTSWTLDSGDIWAATVTTEPKTVLFDGVYGKKEVSKVSCDAVLDWYWASNVLYVYSTSDPDTAYTSPGIEVAQRARCITGTDKDYITIDGLTVKYGNTAGIQNTRGDYWITQNCTVTDCYLYGILYLGHTTSNLPVIGGEIYSNTGSSSSLGISCYFKAQGTTGIVIRDNTITSLSSAYAIGTSSGDDAGAGATSSGSLIYLNNVYGTTNGGISVKYTTDPYIYRNYIHDGAGLGIAINSYTTGAYVYYNIIYNMTKGSVTWNGIDINIGSTGGFAYNNVVYKVAGFCFTLEATTVACDNWTIKNNIFDSSANIAVNGRSESIYIQSPALSVYTFDTNLYNTSTGIAFLLDDGLISSLTKWNAYAGVGTDYLADPLFVSTVTPDFHLQPTSPCVNHGLPVGLTLDYEGNTVPYGATAVDIGAYEFQGLGGAPEIDITDGTTSIATGTTFAFGTKVLASNTDQIFTIANSGSRNLNPSGSPIMTITGTKANQFSVQALPTSPVAANDHVHFTSRFTPTSAGTKVAAISIARRRKGAP